MGELSLYVATTRWRRHHASMLDQRPGLVPVAKGNGYGFGIRRLASEARRMGVDSLAVGSADEAREVLGHFDGRIHVLGPTAVGEDVDGLPARVALHVTSVHRRRVELADRRLVIALGTSMRCRGLTPGELRASLTRLDRDRIDGFSIHLPLRHRAGARSAAESSAWVARLQDAGIRTGSIFVSHLSAPELSAIAARYPGFVFRPMIGTELWLGDAAALTPSSDVLDVYPVHRGESLGYHQQRAPGGGSVVVVAGGTANGIGLEAVRAMHGVASRLTLFARAGLAAVNRNRSPFSWRGRRLWFAEPAHMLTSPLFVAAGATPPPPGAALAVRVRYTTTRFDRIVDVPDGASAADAPSRWARAAPGCRVRERC